MNLLDFSSISKGSCQNKVYLSHPVESGHTDGTEAVRDNRDYCHAVPSFVHWPEGEEVPKGWAHSPAIQGIMASPFWTDVSCSLSSRSGC